MKVAEIACKSHIGGACESGDQLTQAISKLCQSKRLSQCVSFSYCFLSVMQLNVKLLCVLLALTISSVGLTCTVWASLRNLCYLWATYRAIERITNGRLMGCSEIHASGVDMHGVVSMSYCEMPCCIVEWWSRRHSPVRPRQRIHRASSTSHLVVRPLVIRPLLHHAVTPVGEGSPTMVGITSIAMDDFNTSEVTLHSDLGYGEHISFLITYTILTLILQCTDHHVGIQIARRV